MAGPGLGDQFRHLQEYRPITSISPLLQRNCPPTKRRSSRAAPSIAGFAYRFARKLEGTSKNTRFRRFLPSRARSLWKGQQRGLPLGASPWPYRFTCPPRQPARQAIFPGEP